MEEHFEPMIPASRRAPWRAEAKKALGAFSPLEQLAFIAGLLIAAIGLIVMLGKLNARAMIPVPAEGGTLREGIVGTPRYVNPLLVATDADRDLSALVYRGLMRENADGTLVPDLAESYEISADGLTYTFALREAYFQDGEPVTSEDVAYTVAAALDPTLKSAKRIEWQGVAVATPDERTVSFSLKAPYAPFLSSTTLGILPKHIWETIPYENWIYSDRNTKSTVGSGWYRITRVRENSSGIPTSYRLAAYKKAGGETPLIEKIEMRFYANEDLLAEAFESGEVDAASGIEPESAARLAKEGARILTSPLPRIFGLFFNQSQAKIFADASVRKAVSMAIDRDAIIGEVLLGYGAAAGSPIPASVGIASEKAAPSGADTIGAKAALEKAGWKQGGDGIYQKVSGKETQRLSFEIATNDTPELKEAVLRIAEDLREAGIEAIPAVYETGSLNQDIIRPRNFQALFFGQVVSSQSDLFAFWHSSQRADPGLNIAGYASPAADKLLEQGLQALDEKKEHETYDKLASSLLSDMPAAFVYSPAYIYAVSSDIEGITLGHISRPEDRYSAISSWYIDTDKIWKIFTKHTN